MSGSHGTPPPPTPEFFSRLGAWLWSWSKTFGVAIVAIVITVLFQDPFKKWVEDNIPYRCNIRWLVGAEPIKWPLSRAISDCQTGQVQFLLDTQCGVKPYLPNTAGKVRVCDEVDLTLGPTTALAQLADRYPGCFAIFDRTGPDGAVGPWLAVRTTSEAICATYSAYGAPRANYCLGGPNGPGLSKQAHANPDADPQLTASALKSPPQNCSPEQRTRFGIEP